jgi:ABC-type multidrug transport system ATPase subunit
MGMLLKATGLTSHRGKRRQVLLRDIHLTVEPGESVVIQGGSGTGKSTLAELLIGVAKPGVGAVERCGLAAWVPQQFLLYRDLTVAENLEFYSRVNDYQGDPQELLTWCGLQQWLPERAGKLPAGCKKMLQICIALTRKPDLMILDEPFASLDERQMAAVTHLLRELNKAGKGIVVLLSGMTKVIAAARVYRLQNGTLTPENTGSFSVAKAEGET